jgi:CheY-like chemotaxis protein
MEKHKKILVIDDDPLTLHNLVELLERHGHVVIPCQNIYEADISWTKMKNEVSLIVADLCMNPGGLSDELKTLSIGGLYTGWLWIKSRVLSGNSSSNVKHIFMLTAFASELDCLFSNLNITDKLMIKKNVSIVSKTDPDNMESTLIELIRHSK